MSMVTRFTNQLTRFSHSESCVSFTLSSSCVPLSTSESYWKELVLSTPSSAQERHVLHAFHCKMEYQKRTFGHTARWRTLWISLELLTSLYNVVGFFPKYKVEVRATLYIYTTILSNFIITCTRYFLLLLTFFWRLGVPSIYIQYRAEW